MIRFLCAALLLGCTPDFSAFTIVDPDAGNAMPDSGPPTLADMQCDVVWTAVDASSPPECRGRHVIQVAMPFESMAVALGRSDDGQILIAYSALDNPDYGSIATVRFPEDLSTAAVAGPTIDPDSSIGDVVGVDIAIATSANRHRIAYWFRSDFGNEVRYRTLEGEVFSPPQSLGLGVGIEGALDVVLEDDGRAVVGWHDDDAGLNNVRTENADGSWVNAINLRSDGDPRIPGPGAFSLASGGGAIHAAFQWCVTLAASAPSYSVGNASSWSAARTLDNVILGDRTSGVGTDITIADGDIVVAYLDWASGVGEIRMARFGSTKTDPVLTRYLTDLVIRDQPGAHPLVLESDALGRLHLLVATYDLNGTHLEYHRQVQVGGELRWMHDVVATIEETAEAVRVDMKLGPDRRPHIAYWDPVLGAIFYATITP